MDKTRTPVVHKRTNRSFGYYPVLPNPVNSQLFSSGTSFGYGVGVKLNLSYKYVLLGLGIIVAIIIAITASKEGVDKTESKSNVQSDERKMNLSIFPLKF